MHYVSTHYRMKPAKLMGIFLQKQTCQWFTWYFLVYLSWYLDQETEKGLFHSSSQAATCYYLSDHSKIR